MNKKVLNCFQHIDKCESCYEPLPINYYNSWKMQNDKHENFVIELLSLGFQKSESNIRGIFVGIIYSNFLTSYLYPILNSLLKPYGLLSLDDF